MPHWRRSSWQGLQEPFPSLPAKTSTELRPDLLIFVFLSWLRNLSQNMRQPLFTYLPACLFGGKEEKQALKVLNILSLPKIMSVPPPAGAAGQASAPLLFQRPARGTLRPPGAELPGRHGITEGSWKLRPQPGRSVTRPQEMPLLGARIWRTTVVVFVSQLWGEGRRPPTAPHTAGLLSRPSCRKCAHARSTGCPLCARALTQRLKQETLDPARASPLGLIASLRLIPDGHRALGAGPPSAGWACTFGSEPGRPRVRLGGHPTLPLRRKAARDAEQCTAEADDTSSIEPEA